MWQELIRGFVRTSIIILNFPSKILKKTIYKAMFSAIAFVILVAIGGLALYYSDKIINLFSNENGIVTSRNLLIANIGISATYLLTSLLSLTLIAQACSSVFEKRIAAYTVSAGTKSHSFVHLSDLHFVESQYSWRLETGYNPNAPHQQGNIAVAKLLTKAAKKEADFIVITGDVTDSGSRLEYIELSKAISSADLKNLIIIPGNHDVNIIDPKNPSRTATLINRSSIEEKRLARYLRYFELLRRHTDLRSTFIVSNDGTLNNRCLFDFITDLQTDLIGVNKKSNSALLRKLRGAFPLYYKITDEFGAIIFDSCWPTSTSASNAYGWIDFQQTKTLTKILKKNKSHKFLLLLHHQLVNFDGISTEPISDATTFLINSSDILRRTKKDQKRLIVAHGHRHIDAIGKYQELLVVSARSAALDCEGCNIDQERGTPAGFRVLDINVEENTIDLVHHELVT